MEAVELSDRKGAKVAAEADVVRLSEAWRFGRSGLIAGAGVTLGVGSAIIPPHIPWLLLFSSIGIFVGGYMLRQGQKVGVVQGTCVACGKHFASEPVGPLYEDTWVRCSECKEPYRIRLLGP